MLIVIFAAQLLVHIFFLWAQKIKNWGVIDIAWSLGFIVTTLTSVVVFDNFSFSALIVSGMVMLWGLRLSSYLFIRNHGKPEDWRYAQFRQEWKPNENIQGYFKVFVFQGILMFVVTLPQVFFIRSGEVLQSGVLEIAGVLIWLIGMTFEVLADTQLAKFKNNKEKKPRFLMTGVWSLSRHPNYFGEISIWIGFFIMLFNYVPIWTVVGPLVITFFIANVTGIAMLEEKYKDNEDFQKYKEKTNMFFPWPPRK
jgi:steroid 5-alpha reductase family enzyme